jgi:hypothetical protein
MELGPPDSPRPPRWVMVFGVLTILVVLAFVILMLAGGNHGPGRHLRPGAPNERLPRRNHQS